MGSFLLLIYIILRAWIAHLLTIVTFIDKMNACCCQMSAECEQEV